mmetsp:Transcript_65367/g.116537  ORF Transcript_65367/g.116537 Transcript_65367/m.116537 type:complete len:198 (+) Transcript_65367:87-680(+)
MAARIESLEGGDYKYSRERAAKALGVEGSATRQPMSDTLRKNLMLVGEDADFANFEKSLAADSLQKGDEIGSRIVSKERKKKDKKDKKSKKKEKKAAKKAKKDAKKQSKADKKARKAGKDEEDQPAKRAKKAPLSWCSNKALASSIKPSNPAGGTAVESNSGSDSDSSENDEIASSSEEEAKEAAKLAKLARSGAKR